jgi:hypothetical protein
LWKQLRVLRSLGLRGRSDVVATKNWRDVHECECESDTDADSVTMPVFAPPIKARTRRKEVAVAASPPFSPFSSISRGTTGHGSPSPLSAVFPASLLFAHPADSSPPSSSVSDCASASACAHAASHPQPQLAEGAQGAQDDHAAPSSYITRGALGGIGAVLLRALKARMPVWERGGDVRLLGGVRF